MRTPGVLPPNQQDDPHAGTQSDAAAAGLVQQIDSLLHLLNITHEGVVCVDEHCHITIFNQGAEKLFGYKREEVLGLPVTHLVCRNYRFREKHRLAALTRIAREGQLGFRTDTIVCKRKNGERFHTEISLSHGLVPGQRLYTLVVRDTTDRVQQAEQLAYQAEHDHLTDLPNRTLLYERLRAGIARADRYGRKLGVVYMDLDQFKPINDKYGHETGDCLLQAVARRLNDTMRQSDTISRVGGDEFIICLEQIKNEQDAIAATRKIVDSLQSPFQILGRQVAVSASIGIAVYPDHGHETETLLRLADRAMYHAKSQGHSPMLYRSHYG
jgi:diguanylate cyclase (GGDEF)-like protein/PAS domain S-box-containing protein